MVSPHAQVAIPLFTFREGFTPLDIYPTGFGVSKKQ